MPTATPNTPPAASGARPEPAAASAAGPARGSRSSAGGGSLYRGGAGMWSWVAHRITGVLTFFFLFAHVLDTALVRVSPDAYDKVVDTYKNPLVNVLEVGLVGAVLYHALNGLRVTAVDFWSKGTRYQRQMLWGTLAVWVVLMVPAAYFMYRYSFESLVGQR